VEGDDSQPRGHGIGVQPTKAELVAGCEKDDDRCGSRGDGEREREIDGRMQGLTRLSTSGQVSASNDKQPTLRR
jgi:hypothetical protein